MKKLMIILIIAFISLKATAQHRPIRGGYPRSRVVVSVGSPYPYYGYGYYDPFYTPFYRSGYFPWESRLDLQIEEIRGDYQDKIWSARHDKSLSKATRRRKIHELKRERDEAIHQAKVNYYRSY